VIDFWFFSSRNGEAFMNSIEIVIIMNKRKEKGKVNLFSKGWEKYLLKSQPPFAAAPPSKATLYTQLNNLKLQS